MLRFQNLIIFFLLVLYSCSLFDGSDKKVIRVGTSADNPPYESIKDYKVDGFDMDVIRAVADDIGYSIQIENMDFSSMIPSLLSKKVDLVIAGLSISPEREEIVDFSIPYTQANPAIVFRKDLFDQFTLEMLNNKKLAVQIGSVFFAIGKQLVHEYNAVLYEIENNLLALEELRRQKITFLIIEEFQAHQFVSMYPELSFVKLQGFKGTSIAIAMNKNYFLKDEINGSIDRLQKNGTIDLLSKKWGIY